VGNEAVLGPPVIITRAHSSCHSALDARVSVGVDSSCCLLVSTRRIPFVC
jgi:hypothetical protein